VKPRLRLNAPAEPLHPFSLQVKPRLRLNAPAEPLHPFSLQVKPRLRVLAELRHLLSLRAKQLPLLHAPTELLLRLHLLLRHAQQRLNALVELQHQFNGSQARQLCIVLELRAVQLCCIQQAPALLHDQAIGLAAHHQERLALVGVGIPLPLALAGRDTLVPLVP